MIVPQLGLPQRALPDRCCCARTEREGPAPGRGVLRARVPHGQPVHRRTHLITLASLTGALSILTAVLSKRCRGGKWVISRALLRGSAKRDARAGERPRPRRARGHKHAGMKIIFT